MQLGKASQMVALMTFIRQIAGSNLGWDFGFRDVVMLVVHDRLNPSPFNHYLLTILHRTVIDGARDGVAV